MNQGVSSIERTRRSLYPEVGAGGFTRSDGTVDFYARINALIDPDMTVLDFGAGRGSQFDNRESDYRRSLRILQGRVAKIIGVDVADAVRENPFIDEAHVIPPGGDLPVADGSIDLIYSDWVLEHVATPAEFEREVFRALKPGGWFCARTPNRWGITGLGATMVPNKLHARFLTKLQPGREERDVFPTTYLLNTKGRLRRYFPEARWDDFTYIHNPEPGYFLRSKIVSRLANFYTGIAPEALGTNLHVFLRKKA